MGEKGFTKEHSFITKGILVIMLLIHHVFYPDNISNYGIHTVISNHEVQNHIIYFLKICIAGFAFLTAYGMCQKYKNIGESKKEFMRLNIIRLIKLESSVMIVYFAAVLYRRFVMGGSIRGLYIGDGKNIFRLLIFMCIDMLGLAKYAGGPQINVTWWYLSLFILLIVLLPFIFMAYRKFRYL